MIICYRLDLYKKWQERQGRPVIHDEDLIPTEMQGTNVDEFYRITKSFEKESDQAWVRELHRGERSGSAEVPDSTKIQRIEAGESSLIFVIGTHKTIPFPSDSDKYLQPIRKKEKKEKSSWRF